MKNTTMKRIAAAALAVLMCLSVAGCFGGKPAKTFNYTYRDYTTLSPSNWNELTYQDNNDTQIMNYLGSSFFSFDFKFDENGKIVPGEFVIKYDAATALEDISDKVDAKWNVPAGEKGYAYKITLREDLKWNDGTPIKAEDFVYTMKEQLNPDFQNYRADSFYTGATVIKNAQNYVKQGQTLTNVDNSVAALYGMDDLVKGDNGVYTQPDGNPIYFAMTTPNDWCGGSVTDIKSYLDATAFAALEALADENGNVAITDETIALWTTLISTEDWQEDASYLANYLMVPSFTYRAMDFSEVGIFVGDTAYEIILVLDLQLPLIKEDGSLSYQAAYNMASLPLVKKDLYEACKIAPSEGSTLWTSKYHSSQDTTASWGPFMLTSFQAGKQYTLERNDNWYGYALPENEGLYQTERIICDTIQEWDSAWSAFKAGQIDGIGIDVKIADEYKNSEQAFFTPSDFVGSLQLQSSKDSLKGREEDGYNKTILSYVDFRKALSLAINRADYNAECTTASLPGFGLFNSMHYYNVAEGGVYRNSDEAKKVLCEVYAVDYTKYESLDAAVDAITGYNLAEARKLVDKAYDEALAAGDIKATDKVKLTFGTGAINEAVTRRFNFIGNAWTELFKGTKLEGKFEYEVQDFAANWANDFRAGKYDVCMGGWSGAAWDPGYFLLAYLSPAYMYSSAWDTSKQTMTFTMEGVTNDKGEPIGELTMSLIDWYNCLNGKGTYNWSATALEQELRLQLIAALEKEVLSMYYSVPIQNEFSASLQSFKVSYITYEYNTFMSYGGLKYMKYNFTDAEWAAEVAAQGGELDYK